MGLARNVKVYSLYLKYLLDVSSHREVDEDLINLVYYNIRNWGDLINPVLISLVANTKLRLIDIDMRNKYLVDIKLQNELMAIGSILQHATNQTVVWGSGLISDRIKIKQAPLKITAVRGPLTRKALLEQGLDCPEVYGDPALLLPRFFKDEYEKKYELGIIRHNDDEKYQLPTTLRHDKKIRIISLRGEFKKVLRDILSCKAVVSSSLHGLIVPEAYGIPTRRLILNDSLYGGDFKFRDYYSSIGLELEDSIKITSFSTKNELIEKCTKKDISLNLDELIEAYPY